MATKALSDHPKNTNDRRSANEHEEDMTERVLMSLAVDISLLDKAVKRVRVQVLALMAEHDVDPVKTG